MKQTLSLFAAVASFVAFAASPAATQSWVARYVATNAATETALSTPTVFTSTNASGQSVTVSLHWAVASHEGLEVYDSTVSGMTNGLRFALADASLLTYANETNTACKSMSGAYETVAKAVVNGKTNDVIRMVLTMTVGGIAYVGEPINGENAWYCRPNNYTNYLGDFHFRLRRCVMGDIEYKTLTTAQTSFWRSLVNSWSAYAMYTKGINGDSTLLDHDKSPNPVTYDNGDGTLTDTWYYKWHWYTDGDDECKVGIDYIERTVNGVTTKHQVDAWLFEVVADEHVEDVQERIKELLDYADEFDELIEKHLTDLVSAVYAKLLMRTPEYQQKRREINQQIKADLGGIYAAICPDTTTKQETYEKPTEPEPETPTKEPPEIIVPPPEWVKKCNHSSPYGSCGDWRCGICKGVITGISGYDETLHRWVSVTFPTSHNYAWTDDHTCGSCTNSLPNVVCGLVPWNKEWHAGWHDNDGKCVCGGGMISTAHHMVATNYFEYCDETPLVCRQLWYCDNVSTKPGDEICGYYDFYNIGAHAFENQSTWRDGGLLCERLQICTRGADNSPEATCGATNWVGEAHDWSNAVSMTIFDGLRIDPDYHETDRECNHCRKYETVTNTHNYGEWAYSNAVDAAKHYLLRTCEVDFSGNPSCGYVSTTNEVHTFGTTNYYPISDAQHSMTGVCSRSSIAAEGCGRAISAGTEAHSFVSLDAQGTTSGFKGHKCKCGDCGYTHEHNFTYVPESSMGPRNYCEDCGFYVMVSDDLSTTTSSAPTTTTSGGAGDEIDDDDLNLED